MLRTLLISTASTILFGCVCYSLFGESTKSQMLFKPINIGYFLVISTCFVCATIYRSNIKNESIRFLIYQVVSENELSLSDLTEKIKTLYFSSNGDMNSILRKELVMMLEEDRLKLKDSIVVIV